MTQQDDITQRLRDNADLDEAEHGNARVVQLEREAADEIERLRAELSKLRAPVADERDRNATISQIVGLCNRIPGATTWNAAQFMYDEMHRRAALASAPVAGEAVSVDVYVYRQDNRYLATALLPIDTPLRPGLNTLYAAPQASAEDDWKAAIRKFMDTAIPALAAIANVHTPDEIDALDAMPREPVIDQVRRLSQACEELSQQVRPERHKADKDGGQQRTAFDHPVFAFLLGEGQLHGVDFGERAPGAVGKWWWRKDLRAALSAPQAEQGERDA